MNEFVRALCSLSKMLSTKTLKCLLWIQRCKRRWTSCIVHRFLLFVCLLVIILPNVINMSWWERSHEPLVILVLVLLVVIVSVIVVSHHPPQCNQHELMGTSTWAAQVILVSASDQVSLLYSTANISSCCHNSPRHLFLISRSKWTDQA